MTNWEGARCSILATLLILYFSVELAVSEFFHSDGILSYGPLADNQNLLSRFIERAEIDWKPWSSYVGTSTTIASDIEIRSGDAVVVDESMNIQINSLKVKGMLIFRDGTQVFIETGSVIVFGLIQAGSEEAPFQGHLEIILRSGDQIIINEEGRSENLGVAPFAVLGGQLILNGIPEASACVQRTWTKLQRTVQKGDTFITVPKEVAKCWPVGGNVVLSSSTNTPQQSEAVTITFKENFGSSTRLYLAEQLQYLHLGENEKFVSGDRTITLASEAGLLTRSIVIRGKIESSIENGHFVIHRTPFVKQAIIGVEFNSLGFQGTLGRYPIHFHLCRNASLAIVKGCSVINSKQRGLVLHGTHEVTATWNIFYRIAGHTIMLEDGVEMNNLIAYNAVFRAFPPKKVIDNGGRPESDHTPSGIWISNPQNSFIGNVLSGIDDNGVWTEVFPNVRGPSAFLPEAEGLNPRSLPFKEFSGNEIHSVGARGFKTYPEGYRAEKESLVTNLLVWRARTYGLFLGVTHFLTFENLTVVIDSGNGAIDFDRAVQIVIRNAAIVGKSPIQGGLLGTSSCPRAFAASIYPTRGYGGVLGGNRYESVVFDGFRSCTTHPKMMIEDLRNTNSEYMTSSTLLKWVTFPDSKPDILLSAELQSKRWGTDTVIAVQGGDIVGEHRKGYLVWNNSFLLPPRQRRCSWRSDLNGHFCKGTCYRSVSVGLRQMIGLRGITLQIVRLSDGERKIFTNPVSGGNTGNLLLFYANLVASEDYSIEILRPAGVPMTDRISVRYEDGPFPNCNGSLRLHFPQKDYQLYRVDSAVGVTEIIDSSVPCRNIDLNLTYFFRYCDQIVMQLPPGRLNPPGGLIIWGATGKGLPSTTLCNQSPKDCR